MLISYILKLCIISILFSVSLFKIKKICSKQMKPHPLVCVCVCVMILESKLRIFTLLHPQYLCFILREDLTELLNCPNWASICHPPVLTSQKAGIADMSYHIQLLKYDFLWYDNNQISWFCSLCMACKDFASPRSDSSSQWGSLWRICS